MTGLAVVTVAKGGIAIVDTLSGFSVQEASTGLAVTVVVSGGLPVTGRVVTGGLTDLTGSDAIQLMGADSVDLKGT